MPTTASGEPGDGASRPRTLLEKIWDDHVVPRRRGGGPSAEVASESTAAASGSEPELLYVDLHLLHELTSRRAFAELDRRGLELRRPDRTVGTIDHIMPTAPPDPGELLPTVDPGVTATMEEMRSNCERHGVTLYGIGDPRRGIVHVTGPELGLTRPGTTIVCGDSHTSTHGAFGALAFGIGSSEVAEVMATQCLLQRRPKSFEVRFEGRPGPGVTAKDLTLALLARVGVDAGVGHVFEYRGPAVEALSMEGRMTMCNMSIEGGARAGMVAPDETTFAYLEGRELSPRGRAWEAAVERWRRLPSDPGARFDRSVTVDVSGLSPMITFGTHPGMGIPIDHPVPRPDDEPSAERRAALERALGYMRFEPGEPLLGRAVDVVFLGSCTNSRISDLREAAALLAGRRVAPGVRMLVVPGSSAVKRQAEAEGLDRIFAEAGAEWREAGCSMCIAMNGDQLAAGELAVSTTNRNFEGRQGPGGRTLLASPLTAAASAVAGAVADPRRLEGAA